MNDKLKIPHDVDRESNSESSQFFTDFSIAHSSHEIFDHLGFYHIFVFYQLSLTPHISAILNDKLKISHDFDRKLNSK